MWQRFKWDVPFKRIIKTSSLEAALERQMKITYEAGTEDYAKRKETDCFFPALKKIYGPFCYVKAVDT